MHTFPIFTQNIHKYWRSQVVIQTIFLFFFIFQIILETPHIKFQNPGLVNLIVSHPVWYFTSSLDGSHRSKSLGVTLVKSWSSLLYLKTKRVSDMKILPRSPTFIIDAHHGPFFRVADFMNGSSNGNSKDSHKNQQKSGGDIACALDQSNI